MSKSTVLAFHDVDEPSLCRLLKKFGVSLRRISSSESIPGSFWGEPEAGVIGACVYARDDTPLHSILHECSHIICMDEDRRATLERDAGGDDLEEAAVCFLQVLLANELAAVGSERLMQDMDAWGYSFRLGSTARWFRDDAGDARAWLCEHGLLDDGGALLYRCRDRPIDS